eukprot:g7967.t1
MQLCVLFLYYKLYQKSSSDLRWVKYKNNVAKQAEKMKSLCSTEQTNIYHFNRMTEKHFSSKYQDSQNQQPLYEKSTMKLSLNRRTR